ATAGLYSVTLTATGPGGASTIVRTNFILVTNIPPPAAAFTVDTTTGPAPLTVHFTNLTTGNVTGYLWDLGTGAASTALQPTKTYSNAGSYTVTLTATGPGGATTSVRSGYINVNLPSIIRGYALRLDGTNDYVSVPDKADLRITGALTIEALIRRATTGAQHSILEKYDCTSVGGYALRVGADDKLQFASRVNCSTQTVAIGATRLQSNVWYHVAGVFDGSQIRVYVNGTLDGTLNTALNPKPKGSPVKIGARGNDSATSFAGQMDEVRLWTVARTAAEIRSHMFPCLTGTESGLLGYWRFDEGSGTSAADATSHGHTGALLNGALWAGTFVGCSQSQAPPFWRISADLKGHACHLVVTGNPGALVTIETTGDLAQWSPLATFVNITGSFEFLDARNSVVARSYYRVKQEP
ncbi:MAG TPA: LamG-like jellyroll fold domain-containing protein, partial [Verrucomicrobiae bacterium]